MGKKPKPNKNSPHKHLNQNKMAKTQFNCTCLHRSRISFFQKVKWSKVLSCKRITDSSQAVYTYSLCEMHSGIYSLENMRTNKQSTQIWSAAESLFSIQIPKGRNIIAHFDSMRKKTYWTIRKRKQKIQRSQNGSKRHTSTESLDILKTVWTSVYDISHDVFIDLCAFLFRIDVVAYVNNRLVQIVSRVAQNGRVNNLHTEK